MTARTRWLWLAAVPAVALFAFALLLGAPRPVEAAALVVNTLADEQNANGACSLREAIVNANNDDQSGSTDCPAGGGVDTITFAVDGTIVLLGSAGTATLRIFDSELLTIDGAGRAVTISGNDAAGVFIVFSDAALTLRTLTVADGLAVAGAGIYNSGTLTVINSTLSGNAVISGSAGGIMHNGLSLTVNNSTFSGNTARNGGGIYVNAPNAIVTNSTFSGNVSDIHGGGIRMGASGVLTVTNTIIANTTGPDDCSLAAPGEGDGSGGTIIDGGNNLVEAPGSCVFGGAGSLTGVDPKLGALASNGGLTQTQALLSGSPAIDAGAGCGATDQRGLPRPTDGNGDRSARCDIGAYEADTVVPLGAPEPEPNIEQPVPPPAAPAPPTTPAPAPEPAGFGTFSSEPAAQGLSLVLWQGGDYDALTSAVGFGDSVWLFVDGRLVGYIVGAPEIVNARFLAAFPRGLPAGTPVIISRR